MKVGVLCVEYKSRSAYSLSLIRRGGICRDNREVSGEPITRLTDISAPVAMGREPIVR